MQKSEDRGDRSWDRHTSGTTNGSIRRVRESLNEEVAKLREALRQAAHYTERIAALEARHAVLERRREEKEAIRAKHRRNGSGGKPLPPPPLAGDRMVRLKGLKEITGLAISSIYKMINEGRFPKPVKLSQRAVAWRYSDLIAWMGALE